MREKESGLIPLRLIKRQCPTGKRRVYLGSPSIWLPSFSFTTLSGPSSHDAHSVLSVTWESLSKGGKPLLHTHTIAHLEAVQCSSCPEEHLPQRCMKGNSEYSYWRSSHKYSLAVLGTQSFLKLAHVKRQRRKCSVINGLISVTEGVKAFTDMRDAGRHLYSVDWKPGRKLVRKLTSNSFSLDRKAGWLQEREMERDKSRERDQAPLLAGQLLCNTSCHRNIWMEEKAWMSTQERKRNQTQSTSWLAPTHTNIFTAEVTHFLVTISETIMKVQLDNWLWNH